MRRALYDLAALVARLGVGGIVFANGWRKLEDGLNATTAKFATQGAPIPRAWATVTMMTELVGGALLIAGLVVSVTGLVLFLEFLAVFVMARPLNPVGVNEIILLGAATVLLAVVGAGRISVDHMVVIRRRESEAEAEFAADRDAERVIESLRDPGEQRTAPQPAASEAPASEPAAPEPSRREPRKPAPDKPRQEQPPADSSLEDTAPHPLPESKPAPGDTLVAGRRKRRPPAAED